MSIPLIQKPEKDDINTSIIAIKRNIERINMLLGLVDTGGNEPDLSGFATKQELQDAVTELQPVDEVTVGNMHSVTSNAVAGSIGDINNVLSSAMLPRGGGVTQSSAEFLTSLVHIAEQRAPASFGSTNLTDGPAGNHWYNYIWIPHRGGIGGDNYLYGTCILMGMTYNAGIMWLNHLINGSWAGWIGNG